MRLKYLIMIEFATLAIRVIVGLPFYLVYLLSKIVYKVASYPHWGLYHIQWRIGNWLLNKSYEVKHGEVKNPYCLKNLTAWQVWVRLHIGDF